MIIYLSFPGVDSIGFDPQRFAMDYHIIGFRECASEVARYLVTIEGMDIQDPLRLRLMSHLQCFVAQRELSVKSSVTGVPCANWSSLQNSFQPNYSSQGYQAYPATSPATPQQQHANEINQNSFNSSYMPNAGLQSTYLNSTIAPQSPDYNSSGYGTTNSSLSTTLNTTASNNASTTSPAPNQTTTTDQQVENQQPIYTDLTNNTNDRLHLGGNYHYGVGNANQLYGSASNNNNYNANNNNNSKPYRPWHPEMAY